tara:strand:+ start:135 stop:521 length:387 start_codon:yes stop_codon:yes gene_type:complete
MKFENYKIELKTVDDDLSNREIDLDPLGYFIIKVNNKERMIIVEHYLNKIDGKGIAIDPITNKPIECTSKEERKLNKVFKGRTAKEIGVFITEKEEHLISKFDHALYLGRELQKAEACILNNVPYIQD